MTTSGVLMTETLPTIVGMHVVSKSTETMFGKGKRKSTTRRPNLGKSPPKIIADFRKKKAG